MFFRMMNRASSHSLSLVNVGMMRTQELVITLLLIGYAMTRVSMSKAEHAQYDCIHTRYPNLCAKTLMGLSSENQNVNAILTLVNKTIFETNLPTSYFASLETVQDAPQAASIAVYCEELMGMSLKRLDQSLKALKSAPIRNKHNIQTWLSASLTFQQTCKDYAHAHYYTSSSKLSSSSSSSDNNNNSLMVLEKMSKKMDYLSQLGSNSLSLVNRITSQKRESDDEIPKWVSAKGRKLLQGGSNSINANAVVAQDGSGDYRTVSEAIKAASGKSRFVIHVKEGVYKEKIRSNKDGITLIGDGKYSTVIVGDDSCAKGTSMPDTATFTITGDGFMAKDIGFHNNAGPQGEQALALNIASDRSVLYRCSFAGYQDTLYAHALRQFYRECDIYGTIDFIFGNAAAVFQSCNLVLRRPHGGGYNAILANGRTDPGQNTGFSVQKCSITAGSDLSPVKHSYESFLGRPWKEYSRSVVMESTIDDAIGGRGWIEWPGYGSSVLKTLYFAEYGNEGAGAGTAKRVQWPGFHVIGAQEASKFTVATFISGTSWLPSTGVAFVSGLN